MLHLPGQVVIVGDADILHLSILLLSIEVKPLVEELVRPLIVDQDASVLIVAVDVALLPLPFPACLLVSLDENFHRPSGHDGINLIDLASLDLLAHELILRFAHMLDHPVHFVLGYVEHLHQTIRTRILGVNEFLVRHWLGEDEEPSVFELLRVNVYEEARVLHVHAEISILDIRLFERSLDPIL